MDRREALSTVTLLLGGAVIGAESFLSGCTTTPQPSYKGLLSSSDVNLLDEIAETILPETETSPGAKEAEVGQFMNVIVTECYDPDEQQIFQDGLVRLNEVVRSTFGKRFGQLQTEQRHELLMTLEEEVKNYSQNKNPDDPDTHYYRMIKQLTLLGFLTSEPGVTKAMRHVAVPGRYDGCVPHKEGDKAWA